MTTSTPALDLAGKKTEEEKQSRLPDFDTPSVNTINTILNYSKNLEIKKSRLVNEVELIKS